MQCVAHQARLTRQLAYTRHLAVRRHSPFRNFFNSGPNFSVAVGRFLGGIHGRIYFFFFTFPLPSFFRSTGMGKSFFNGITLIPPFASLRMISISGENSESTWRHAPHGGRKLSFETMAMALNFRWPAHTALKIAFRSAQIVSPYELFSTLQPAKKV